MAEDAVHRYPKPRAGKDLLQCSNARLPWHSELFDQARKPRR